MLRSDYAEKRAKTFVELDFASGESKYTVRREIIPHIARKTEEVSYTDSVSLSLPDGTVIDRSREADLKILEIIGLDREQFAQIVMIAQNDFLRFLQSGTEERVKILRRIFGTGALKLFQESLKAKTKEKDDERRILIRDFEKYGLDPYRRDEQFAIWGQSIKDDEAAVSLADAKLEEYDRTKEALAGKIAVAEGLCKLFAELAARQTALADHNAKAGGMAALAERRGRGEIAARVIKPFADKASEAETAYGKAMAELAKSRKDAENAETELRKADEIIAGLPSLEETGNAFATLKQKWMEMGDRLKKLRALKTDHAGITEKQSALDSAKSELAATEAAIGGLPPLDETKSALDRLRGDWEAESEKLKKITALTTDYSGIETKKRELSDLQTELTAVLDVIRELQPVDEAKDAFAQLKNDAEKTGAGIEKLAALQRDFDEISLKEELLEAERAGLVRLNGDYNAAKNKYDALYERFLLNRAGLLAQNLRDGEPCPVCGSAEHPSPALIAGGDISDGKLKKLSSDSDTAKKKADEKSSACAALISEINTLAGRFDAAVAGQIAGCSFKTAKKQLEAESAAMKSLHRELTAKSRATETALAELKARTEIAAARREELSPKCTELSSAIATLTGRFAKDVAEIAPEIPFEEIKVKLSQMLDRTQTKTGELGAKKDADEKAFDELKTNMDRLTKRQTELSVNRAALTSELSALTDRFIKDFSEYVPGTAPDSAGTELPALLGEAEASAAELTAKKNADEKALAELKTNWETAKKRQADGATEYAKASALVAEREKHGRESLDRRDETGRLFRAAMTDNGFASEADYTAALVTDAELAAISKQLADYEDGGKQIRRDIVRLESETGGKERPDLEKLNAEAEETKAASDGIRASREETKTRLDNTSRMLKELKKSSEALAATEKEYAALKGLSDTANGRLDFETYAQTAYFERVLRAANLRLRLLSQNRYILIRKGDGGDGRRRTGLEIEVADSYTGRSRGANSLSGGESFMASLSLALGLSDVVQQSAGGIRLDAMFIDEGFGSLDAEVLELAVRTLADMAGGNRIIGIISHVAELRERIDKQVRVEKSTSGSKIRLIV
jgi:exonuclease SbcC